jgi:ABC-type sugar transport system substrate-binding protein
VPIKYKDNDNAKRAEETVEDLLQKPVLHRVRDNWLDVAIVVDLEENLNRAAMRKEKFESLLTGGIDVTLDVVQRIKRKTT